MTDSHERELRCIRAVARCLAGGHPLEATSAEISCVLRETLGLAECRITPLRHEGPHGLERLEMDAICRGTPAHEENQTAIPIFHGIEPLGSLFLRGRGLTTAEVEMAEGVAGSLAPALRAAQQAEQLAEIERARGEFLANLSHELRTPLNAILGYAEIALEHCEGDEPRILPREIVSAISRNGEALLGHVENLLQLSQLRLGRERKELVEVDLEELFHASLARARRVAFRKPIEFDLKVDPAVRRVCLDRGKVDRIIGSILTNAVKFTNRGAIQLTARPRSETGGTSLPSPPWPWERVLSVSIRDTGVGIQESDLPKIFQAFRKLDASDTSPYGGLGLGLTVSRRLTEILGGTIQVDSRPGQGSLFEILLPVQSPRTAAPAV